MGANEIRYDFTANHDALDHVQRLINDIEATSQDVHKIFQALQELWEGQAPQALQEAHVRVDGMLQHLLKDIGDLGRIASGQQDEMQELDARLAGGF